MGFKSLITTALVSASQEIARQLNPNDEVHQKTWMKVHQQRLLDKGTIEKLVDALRARRTNRLGGRFEQ